MLTVRSTINISSQTVPPIIPVVQGDTGRAIMFTLADFTIPAGATATYYVQKPSGEAVYNNATIDGNTVLVELTAQSIIEKGDNYGQVRISSNGEVVTSFDFILLVKEFRGIDAVQSLTEMNIFDKAVEQASDAIDEVKTDALDDIGDAKEAALQEIEQTTGNFADDFSASATYAAGDYVMHSGQLYRFTANHAAGAWTGSDAEAVTVGEELTDLKAETTDLKEDLNETASDLKSALNDNVNGIITGEKVKSYTFPWVDGGVNASTGALNSNAYAIRTNPVQFNTDSISIDDSTQNNIWRLYWVSYSDETAISTSKVDSGSFANADFPVTLSVNPNLYYRFMYLDTSSTARPSADGLTMVGNTSEPFQIQYVPDVVRADVDGIKQIVSLSSLTWVAGRINSSGANFNGAGYAYRTNDYYEFENEIVTVQDANANHANYTLTLYGYDKETSVFITGLVWPYADVANKKIRVNTEYKYRFMYVDTTSTEMPDYTKLSLDYGYTSNSFASVDEKLESLSDADPFRVKNAIRKPRITFIDDDGHIQFYRLIYPLMLQKGIPYCVAYMANEYPYYPGNFHMTYAQCQDVVDAGGEILGHGTTDLTTLSLEAAETDVTNTKAILEQYGFDVKGYVYPSGRSNPDVREMIAKHYAYGMKTNEAQQVYRVNTNCVPSYYINRCNNGGYYDAQTGDYANVDTASLDYMKSVVDECVSQNGWLIFVSHAAYMPEGSRRPGYENVDQVQLLSDTIDYILSLKIGGTDIDIVTASEAFAMFGNAYEAGDYLGYWNESQNYHTLPGCAISKEGKWDFSDSQRITHS